MGQHRLPANILIPVIDIRRLRGQLAEEMVGRKRFANESGITVSYLNGILREQWQPGPYARFGIARAAHRRGWHDVVLSEDGTRLRLVVPDGLGLEEPIVEPEPKLETTV